MSTETNKEIIEKVNAAFEQNNPDVFLEYCSDDVKWEMAGGEVQNGKESIRKFMSGMGGDHKLTALTTRDVIAEGDRAACFGDMTMDEKGESTDYSYCDAYRFANDKIVELRSYVVKHKVGGESEQAASA
jgi:ketosteroid isomerase-like protein